MMRGIGRNFVEWCGEVLDGDEYVLLDTETTGLGSNDQIVELAIISTGGEVLYNKLLRPSCPIGERAMRVHRITEEMVSTAQSFKEQWPEIEQARGGRGIIPWNAAFDARMLVQTAMASKITLRKMDFYCAMRGYTEHYRFSKWSRLSEACAQQGIDFQQDHRALGDAMAILEVMRAMAKRAKISKVK